MSVPSGTVSAMTEEELIRSYWQACDIRDWAAFGALVTDDVVYRIPQTREVVRGKEDYVEFNRTYPSDWRVIIERIVAGDGQAVSWTTFVVGDERMTGLCFFKINSGLITEIDDFWPEPYHPPTRETPVVDRY
jgi:ketosteroid isomerase-like protein